MGSARVFKNIGMTELPVEYSEIVFSPNHMSSVVLDKVDSFNLVVICQSNLYKQETAQRFLNRFDAFASALVSKGDPSRVTIPELFDEVEEKLAAMPEPAGSESDGTIKKRFLMGD